MYYIIYSIIYVLCILQGVPYYFDGAMSSIDGGYIFFFYKDVRTIKERGRERERERERGVALFLVKNFKIQRLDEPLYFLRSEIKIS